jgi:1,4-alpha-glucan branching enzyme
MLKKSYTPRGDRCRVTFKLPADVNAQTAYLAGDFNDWDLQANPMKKLKDGSFSVTITLNAGERYRFRYWLDGERWENDWAADAYEPNPFGGEDSVVQIPEKPSQQKA